MAGKSREFAIFTHPGHLLAALHTCRTDGSLFPVQALTDSGQSWAMPLSEFSERKHLKRLAQQHGWTLDIASGARHTTPVPLWKLLSGCLSYRDPFQPYAHGNQALLNGSSDGASSLDYNPDDRGMQYLLGARDELHAQDLLNILTNELTLGIHATPIFLNDVDQPSPFCHFWSVTMERPSLTALRAADRAWWGPVRQHKDDLIQIFLQWPYSLDIPDVYLYKINWEITEGCVLLSQDAPQSIVLRKAPDHPMFAELVQVADLRVSESCKLELQATAPGQSPVQFAVQVKLVQQSPQPGLDDRIRELESEIKLRKELLEHLKDEWSNEEKKLDLATQPLLIYPDQGGVPFELRRLLVEWSDQHEELQSLRYQKLTANDLPADLFPSVKGLHILTTAAALGEVSSSDLGMRLREYKPLIGPSGNFDLLLDWAEYGLRLFVPHHQWLDLYPQLRPSQVAAEKLAQAVLPDGSSRDWIALLMPDSDSQRDIRALQLRRNAFRPLLESFAWNCALNLRINAPQAVEQVSTRIVDQTRKRIEHEITSRAQRLAMEHMNRVAEQLRDSLGTCAESLSKIGEKVYNHSKQVDQVIALTSEVSANSSQHLPSVADVRKFVNVVDPKLKELTRLEEQQAKHEAELERLRSKIAQIKAKLAEVQNDQNR